MLSNTFVTEPRLAIPDSQTKVSDLVSSLDRLSGASFERTRDDITSLEYYVRQLVAASAATVYLPGAPEGTWASPSNLKVRLPPSLQKRVRFVDRDRQLWAGIREYFKPIVHSIPTTSRSDSDELRWVAWGLYLLVLAMKQRSEVALDANLIREECRHLARRSTLPPEARARLAVIEGLFATYDQQVELPTFRVNMSRDGELAERIDDIFADAHFLEVSALRRHFGVAQNRYALTRDMRTLIKWISKTKKWAVGLLTLGSHLAAISTPVVGMTGKLVEALSLGEPTAPILTTRYQSNNSALLVAGKYSVYSGEVRTYIVSDRASKRSLLNASSSDRTATWITE